MIGNNNNNDNTNSPTRSTTITTRRTRRRSRNYLCSSSGRCGQQQSYVIVIVMIVVLLVIKSLFYQPFNSLNTYIPKVSFSSSPTITTNNDKNDPTTTTTTTSQEQEYHHEPIDEIYSMELGWDEYDRKTKNKNNNNTSSSSSSSSLLSKWWLNDLCPEVVLHFSQFPLFRKLYNNSMPFMTTQYAAQSVCLMKVTKQLVNSVNAQLYIHAGSQLGSILHGSPIPWDDDVDVLMNYEKSDLVYEKCNTQKGGYQIHSKVIIHCNKFFNGIKLWFQNVPNSKSKHLFHKETSDSVNHYSPFVDLFVYQIQNKRNVDNTNTNTTVLFLQEVPPYGIGKRQDYKGQMFPIHDFFPTRIYYFGGIYMVGSNLQIPIQRYNLTICKTPKFWHHRLEMFAANEYANQVLNCTKLQQQLGIPFIIQRRKNNNNNNNNNNNSAQQWTGQQNTYSVPEEEAILSNGKYDLPLLFPPITESSSSSSSLPTIETPHFMVPPFNYQEINTTIQQRQLWYSHQPESDGQQLTNEYLKRTGFNNVEVDNTISPYKDCYSYFMNQSQSRKNNHTQPLQLKVVEFNAERGRWWLESVTNLKILQDADIILLNEMDIGMARSDQQHTTRQMAKFLQMNYAWGFEYLELTNGNQDDLNYLPTPKGGKGVGGGRLLQNNLGLHGNAFLTRCGEILDPIIFRNPVGQYFSHEKLPGINANGLEKRLGGRMGMFGRIQISNSRRTNDGQQSPPLTLVVGSIHKLGEFGTSFYGNEIKQYIGNSKAVIAGDQNGNYCNHVGLRLVQPGERGNNKGGNTWPASCHSFGTVRGDNICTNMIEIQSEMTTKPCYEKFGINVQLGDHALTSVILDVSS